MIRKLSTLLTLLALANAMLLAMPRACPTSAKAFEHFRAKVISLEPFVAPLTWNADMNEHCEAIIQYSHQHEHWNVLRRELIDVASSHHICQLKKIGTLRAKSLPFSGAQVSESIVPFLEEVDSQLKLSPEPKIVAGIVAEEKTRLSILSDAQTFEAVLSASERLDASSRTAYLSELFPLFRHSLVAELSANGFFMRLRHEVPLMCEPKWMQHFVNACKEAAEALWGSETKEVAMEEYIAAIRERLLRDVEEEDVKKDLLLALDIFRYYRSFEFELKQSLSKE